jgi:hypothetical protein
MSVWSEDEQLFRDTSGSVDDGLFDSAVFPTSQLRDHERRLKQLETHVFFSSSSASTSQPEHAPPPPPPPPFHQHHLHPGAAASTTTAVTQTGCVVSGCLNRTGLTATSPPNHLLRHLRSQSHFDAALQLRSGVDDAVVFCECVGMPSVEIDVAKTIGEKKGIACVKLAFEKVNFVRLCASKACLRIVRPEDPAALLEARRVARLLLGPQQERVLKRKKISSTTTNADDESTMRGDQAVAIAFAGGRAFHSPGAVYLTFDAAANQLRVQLERPSASQPFHVAHVARTHRWMKQVTHFAPSVQQLWGSHVAVADTGFVDAFVLVHPNVPLAELDIAGASARELLHERICCDEWLLCAGRDDGWLELIRAADLPSMPHLVPLPLAHIQPHQFRALDANAFPPTLPLMSTSAPLDVPVDDRLQHFAPLPLDCDGLQLEMLCKVTGWYLVAQTVLQAEQAQAVDDERVAGFDQLLPIAELVATHQRIDAIERENALLRRRLDIVAPAATPEARRPQLDVLTVASVEEAERALGTRSFVLYRRAREKDSNRIGLCMRLADGALAHGRVMRRADGSFTCVREMIARTLEELIYDELGLH